MAQSQQNRSKSIQTILTHLPTFFHYYSPSEQLILDDFITSLQSIDFQTDRTQFQLKLSRFITKYSDYSLVDELSHLLFLRFALGYFNLALNILHTQGKYLTDFFNYILKALRDVFRLLRQGTPLSDDIWYDIYFSCIQLNNPLTQQELHIINFLNKTYFSDKGYSALNRNLLLKKFRDQGFPFDTDFFSEFTTRMQSEVALQFFPSAFDLTSIFFKCSLLKPINFNQIIDFSDPDNTTLRLSSIHQIPDQYSSFPTYQGILIVPVGFSRRLESYFQQLQEKNILKVDHFDLITNYRWSTSFSLYKSHRGWSPISIRNWYGYMTGLITAKETDSPYFLTTSFNTKWNYKKFFHYTRDKIQAVKFFCKAASSFPLFNLPGNYKKSHNDIPLFNNDDRRLLKTFYLNKISQTVFCSRRLLNLRSLRQYWISPQIPFKKFSPILKFFPSSNIVFTDTSYHLLVIIPPETAQQISTDLGWDITPIQAYYQPCQPDYDWFDSDSLQWYPSQLIPTDSML